LKYLIVAEFCVNGVRCLNSITKYIVNLICKLNQFLTLTSLLPVGGSRVGSVGGLHKSMTRLSSSQQINLVPVPSSVSGPTVISNNRSITTINGGRQYNVSAAQKVSSGGVTVTTASSNKSIM